MLGSGKTILLCRGLWLWMRMGRCGGAGSGQASRKWRAREEAFEDEDAIVGSFAIIFT